MSVKAFDCRMIFPRPDDNVAARSGGEKQRRGTAGRGAAGVVIVEGPPCSGKTTLARRLGQELGGATVLLERAGREILPRQVMGKIGEISWEIVMAIRQWREIRRARKAAGGGWVVADFSPLKAAVRLGMMGQRKLAGAAEALAAEAVGPRAWIVALLPTAQAVVECWRRRGPDELTPEREEKLKQLAYAYREYFARPLPWTAMAFEEAAGELGRVARRVREWVAAGRYREEATGQGAGEA